MHLTVPCQGGQTLAVMIYDLERGLAVQRHAPVDHWDWPGWGVVHVASGRLVVHCVLPTRERAREAQQALLTLAVDWTQAATGSWVAESWRLAEPVVCHWEEVGRFRLAGAGGATG